MIMTGHEKGIGTYYFAEMCHDVCTHVYIINACEAFTAFQVSSTSYKPTP